MSLDRLWAALLSSPAFRHESFEPVLASVFFTVFIFVWWFIDSLPHCAAHSYRLSTGVCPKAAWRRAPGEAGVLQAALYLLPWLVLDSLWPRRVAMLESFDVPTVGGVLSDVCCSLFVFDTLFYAAHRALHAVPQLRAHHARHHALGGALCAADSVRHSVLDGATDVLCSVAALNFVKSHPLSRALHNALAIWWIVEAHAAYDLPFMAHQLCPRVFAGPVMHKEHHARGDAGFAKLFTFWDAVCGTRGARKSTSSLREAQSDH